MPLFETSARLDSECDNVEAIFLTLAHKLKSQKPFMPIEQSRKSSNLKTININQGQDASVTSTCC
ncbi:hypothetical protein CBL_01278 [Carabus blaptoides fortunei]